MIADKTTGPTIKAAHEKLDEKFADVPSWRSEKKEKMTTKLVNYIESLVQKGTDLTK